LFAPETLLTIAYTGGITLFVAATIAIVATDIKKVLAYSTVSQLGYMMLALGVGGWAAGLFHLVTHAFFKALLFLGSGSVIYGCHHEQDMRKMGGLFPKLPITGFSMLMGVFAIVARFYRQVEQGKALIVNTMASEPKVLFTGGVVYPVVNRAEVMDLSVKTIDIDRRGKEGLICNDNIRADINVTFFVRVNKTRDDVLKVAQSIGCARASDPKTHLRTSPPAWRSERPCGRSPGWSHN
jgi:hypothetical protein